MRSLLEKDFVFVVGKGGTGKTTVSIALALAAAKQGKRVLLAMCQAKPAWGDVFGVGPLGSEIVNVQPGFDVVNMHPHAALEEYGALVLKSTKLSKALFGNQMLSTFIRGVPGMDAWSMLGKAFYHATANKKEPDAYDLVILDAPATGHGLSMLRVPIVITEVAPTGLLRREANQALALLRDKVRSSTLLVTLAEDMPVRETEELYVSLRDEIRVPMEHMVVNQWVDPIFEEAEREQIYTLEQRIQNQSKNPPSFHALLKASVRASIAETLQESHVNRLISKVPLRPVFFERLTEDASRLHFYEHFCANVLTEG